LTYTARISGHDAIIIERDGLNSLIEGLRPDSESDLGLAFDSAIDACLELRRADHGRIIVTGIGKSGHVGRKIAATFSSTGTRSVFVHAAEASHGDLGMIDTNDIVLALSNSGETRELSDIIQYCARFQIKLIAITSGGTSALAKKSDILLQLPSVPEACPDTRAPTTSTTMTLALGDALAVALLKMDAFKATDFKVFHPGGKLGAALRKVGDISQEGQALPLIGVGAPMQAAVSQMSDGGFGIVGVCDASGKLLGVVTDGDLRRNIGRDLISMSAGDIMSSDPITVTPKHLAAEALGLMNAQRIQAVFIVEAERPVGILHLHDFLKQGIM
jgi:arabinose-5-phosphate isomerase